MLLYLAWVCSGWPPGCPRLCRVLPVEFVVRGYLEGSGWVDYQATGSVCGVALPRGLRQCDRLPEPVFTPATKAEDGEHDQNIDADEATRIAAAIAGPGPPARLAETAIAIYNAASAHAAVSTKTMAPLFRLFRLSLPRCLGASVSTPLFLLFF